MDRTEVIVIDAVKEGYTVSLRAYFHVLRSPDGLGDSWTRDSDENVFTTRTDGTATLRVSVNEDGLWPELIKVIASGGDGLIGTGVAVPGRCRDDPRRITIRFGAPPGALFRDFLGYHMNLLEEIGKRNGEIRRHMQFFAELNLNTHDSLVALTVPSYQRPHAYTAMELRTRMRRLRRTLEDRLIARAVQFDAFGTIPRFPRLPLDPGASAVVPTYREDAVVASAVQTAVLGRHFQDLSDACRAFENFANGELRLQLADLGWSSQPSSGYYFLFAEFAQLAIEEGIDSAVWEALRPALIYTQSIMASVYRTPHPRQAHFFDYEACLYDGNRAFDPPEKEQLRHCFANLDEGALLKRLARNTCDFLGGTLLAPGP